MHVAYKEVTLYMQICNIMLTTCCVACNVQQAVDLCVRARHRSQEERLMEKQGFEWIFGLISYGLARRPGPGRASCLRIPNGRGRGCPVRGEEESSSSYADPVGLVHVKSLCRVYPESVLTGHCVPPMFSVAIPKLYLVKTFILSQVMFSSRGERVLLWH